MPTPPANDRFAVCLAHLLRTEGGFNNVPGDRGGPTNMGISLRFAVAEAKVDPIARRALDLDMDGDVDVADIRALTPATAGPVYRRCFWDRYRCGQLPAPIDGAVFDQAVNGGGVAAVRMLQQSINRCYRRVVVSADGVMGPATVSAAGKVLPSLLLAAYRNTVEARYRDIVAADPSQRKFLNGWINRAAALGRA